MTVPSSARFFALTSIHPPYARLMLVLITGVGAWTIVTNPGELDSALGMVLFIQMFLASTGFLRSARRGHFDPLLAGQGRRTGPMVWHFVVSIAPGAAAWTALSAVACLLGNGAAVSALRGERAAALAIVSLIAWTTGVMLPRGAAGIVWVGVLLSALIGRVELLTSSSLTTPALGPALNDLVQALALLVCPFLLLGHHPVLRPGVLAAAVSIATLIALAMWWRADRLDLYLVDRT
jgi:hypothetical protein